MEVKFITKDGRKIPIKIASGEIHSSPRMIKKEKKLELNKAKELKKFKKKQMIQKGQDENVHESISSITQMFPEGTKVKSLGKEMSDHGGNFPEKYEITMKGGMFTGDITNLERNGIHISSLHATKDGDITFETEIPKHLARSSPKKENKVEFGMKNLGQPHIKQGTREIASSNIDETEQEMFRIQSKARKENRPLTAKEKKRVDEIERMADPHEIGNAPSPREDRT